MTLDMLRPGEHARLRKNGAQGALKIRLTALGFIRHTHVEVLERSLFGQTMIVRIDARQIFSMRRQEAAQLQVERLNDV